MRIKNAEGSAHLFTAMAGEQPHQAAQLLVQQRREVEHQRPEEKREHHNDESIGDELFAWCHHIQSESNLIAVVSQLNMINNTLQDVATRILQRQMACRVYARSCHHCG